VNARKVRCSRRAALTQRTLRRMSPSAERALLPTSHGKEDEWALMLKALISIPEHSEASRPTFCRSPDACLPVPTARRKASR
jgi:hypothetical protein